MTKRRNITLLPSVHQTDELKRFFETTVDQLFQPGKTDLVSGYIGRKPSYYDASKDFYKVEPTEDRQERQLEPAVVSLDDSGEVDLLVLYDDFVNSLRAAGAPTASMDRLLASPHYSWAPPIDLDKLVNFHNYYWVEDENIATMMLPPSATYTAGTNQLIYALPAAISTWGGAPDKIVVEVNDISMTNFTVAAGNVVLGSAPAIGSTVRVRRYADLVNTITGMVQSINPTTGLGLSSGQVVHIIDGVRDEILWIDGIGKSIQFISDMEDYTGDRPYVVIDRTCKSRNIWSRRNRWVHKSVLPDSAIMAAAQAQRPIIEFEPDIVLFNYGQYRVEDITCTISLNPIKIATADVAAHEINVADINGLPLGSVTVDNGHILADGDRVLVRLTVPQWTPKTFFAAGTIVYQLGETYKCTTAHVSGTAFTTNNWVGDPLASINNQIFSIEQVIDGVTSVYGLLLETDTNFGAITKLANSDIEYWFNDTTWPVAQAFSAAPLYDTFDKDGQSFSNYEGSNFAGSKLFNYAVGNGAIDTHIGQALKYNEYGQIVFENNLYTADISINGVSLDVERFYAYDRAGDREYDNAWHLSADDIQLFDGSIPINLQANPDNEVPDFISRNQWFDHFSQILTGQDGFIGEPYAINNWRDTARDLGKGKSVLQHNASLIKPMILASSDAYNVVDAILYARNEYEMFIARFLRRFDDLIDSSVISLQSSVSSWVDSVLTNLIVTKQSDYAFALSGMAGGQYFIPPTPTFLGLLPAYKPNQITQDGVTYLQGHDGSLRPLFGDYKDSLLLELENRIYRSINAAFLTEDAGFSVSDYVAGYFPSMLPSQYTRDEFLSVIKSRFEGWCQKNGVDYRTRDDFSTEDRFTWNYSSIQDNNGRFFDGHWRGIYRYVFGTDRPHLAPWEMLGFGDMPVWWVAAYGPAPYTAGNLQMWQDIEDGRILEGSRAGISLIHKRPGLLPTYAGSSMLSRGMLPVNEAGVLLDPIAANVVPRSPAVVAALQDWKFGDGADIETKWMRSAGYAFDLCSTLYLLRPVTFIATGWDTLDEITGPNGQPISKTTGKRPRIADTTVHGERINGVQIVAFGIQQWLSDYLILQGKTPSLLGDCLRRAGVRLAHRVAGFTTFDNLRITADNFGLVPQEDIQIKLHQSSSTREDFYSGMIIEWTGSGYRVYGFDAANGYFPVFSVDEYGRKTHLLNTDKNARSINPWQVSTYYARGTYVSYQQSVYGCIKPHTSATKFESDFWEIQPARALPDNTVLTIPRFTNYEDKVLYGQVINSRQEVVNLILGYGAYLESRGWSFVVSQDNGVTDWTASARAFANWSALSWEAGYFVALSPAARLLTYNSDTGSILNIEQVVNGFYGLYDRNGQSIPREESLVNRSEGTIEISAGNYDVFGARVRVADVEHALIFSNTTIFGDTIYQPLYNLRQPRLKLNMLRAEEWKGRFDAPGYIIVNGEIKASFEKSAENLRTMFDIEQADDPLLRDYARHLIGFQKRDYLTALDLSDTQQFEFYQGLIQNKGSVGAFNRLLRSDIIGQNRNLEFREEWAVRIGDYGAHHPYNRWEVEIRSSDIRNQNQLFNFDSNHTPDDWVNIQLDAGRWVNTPKGKNPSDFSFLQTSTSHNQALPSAGYVRINEVDFVASNMSSLYSQISDALYAGKTLDVNMRSWIVNDEVGDWSVYKFRYLSSTGGSNPIKAISIETTDNNAYAVVKLTTATGLTQSDIGRYVIFPQEIETISPMSGMATIVAVDEVNDTFTVDITIYQGIEYNEPAIGPEVAILEKIRFGTVAERNSAPDEMWEVGDLCYIDDAGNGTWSVYQLNEVEELLDISSPTQDNYFLATAGNRTGVQDFTRFAPLFWTTNFTNTMMASLSTVGSTLQADAIFYKKNDLAGIIWESEDHFDHPLTAFDANFDYSNCILDFTITLSGSTPDLASVNGSVLTIEGLDSNGQPRTWYVRLVNYRVNGNDTSADISLNFDNLAGGFGKDDPVYPHNITRMLIGFIPLSYDGTDTILDTPETARIVLSNISATGSNSRMHAGTGWQPHELRMTNGYDDTYNVTPERIVRNTYLLGYRNWFNHYVGMSHYFAWLWSSDENRFIAQDIANPINIPTQVWHADLCQRLSAYGYKFICSISYEMLDSFMPSAWRQLDTDGLPALSGWTPPSSFFSPCNATAMAYLDRVFVNFANILHNANLPIHMQVGEPWWWVDFRTQKPYFYDPYTKAKYLSDTGNVAPVITDMKADMDAADLAYLDWLGLQLATSTSAKINAVKAAYPDTTSYVLVYLPQILSGYSAEAVSTPEVKRVNMPPAWSYPAFDILQVEDYDFVIENRPDLSEAGRVLVEQRLNYPRSKQQYFSGYVLHKDNPEIWSYASNAVQQAWNYGLVDVFIWAYSEIMRDGYVNVLLQDHTTQPGSVSTLKFQSVRQQGLRVENEAFQSSLLYRLGTLITSDHLEPQPLVLDHISLVDPRIGMIAGVADRDLTYKLDYDPAVYFGEDRWGAESVGQLWWDLSAVRFLDPYTDDLSRPDITDAQFATEMVYRTTNWNIIAPDTSVDVYEWVRAEIAPDDWRSLNALDPTGTYAGLPYADPEAYVERDEYSERYGVVRTYYYYWVKNRVSIPTNKARFISAQSCADIITNPSAAGLVWIAPVSRYGMIISNISENLTDNDTVLQLDFEANPYDGPVHQQWALVRIGDEESQPPVTIWTKLLDSLAGFDRNLLALPDPSLHVASSTGVMNEPRQNIFAPRDGDVRQGIMDARQSCIEMVNYILARHDYINDRADFIDDLFVESPLSTRLAWVQADGSTYIEPLPPSSEYDFVVNSIEERDAFFYTRAFANFLQPGPWDQYGWESKAWDADLTASPRVLLNGLNEARPFWSVWQIDLDMVQDSDTSDDLKLLLSQALLYTKTYDHEVTSIAARDALPDVANGDRVLVRDTSNNDFWTIWAYFENASPHYQAGYNLVQAQRYRTNDFIARADWYADGYDDTRPPVVRYATAALRNETERDNPTSVFVRVDDDGMGNWMWTVYDRDTSTWNVVARQNATVQLSENFFDISRPVYGWNGIDSGAFDMADATNRDGSFELRVILRMLVDKGVLTSLEVNELFFSMLHFVHSQQDQVDWVIPTSYMSVIGYKEPARATAVAQPDNIDTILQYLDEVKPYRVKIREFVRGLINDDDNINIRATDFDKPVYYDADLKKYRTLGSADAALLAAYPYADWYADPASDMVRNIEATVTYDRIWPNTSEGDASGAAQFIEEYYQPTDTMPEKSLSTLLNLDFKGTIIDGRKIVDGDIHEADTRIVGTSRDQADVAINGASELKYNFSFLDAYLAANKPEELCTIKADDAIVISIMENWGSGVPKQIMMSLDTDVVSGDTISTKLDFIPQGLDNVIVHQDGQRINNAQVTFDPFNASLVLPIRKGDNSRAARISCRAIGYGATTTILDQKFVLSDGSSNIAIPLSPGVQVALDINGVNSDSRVTQGTNSITISPAPQTGDKLTITTFSTNGSRLGAATQTLSYNAGKTWTIAADGQSDPVRHATIIVEKNGIRLTPPKTYYGTFGTTNRSIALDSAPTNPTSVEVWLNGLHDDSHTSIVDDVLVPNDISFMCNDVRVVMRGEQDFDLVGTTLSIPSASVGDVITVTTFNADSLMTIKTHVRNGVATGEYLVSAPLDQSYTWVSVNGLLMNEGFDYTIEPVIDAYDTLPKDYTYFDSRDVRRKFHFLNGHTPSDRIVITTFGTNIAPPPLTLQLSTKLRATSRHIDNHLNPLAWELNALNSDQKGGILTTRLNNDDTSIVIQANPNALPVQMVDSSPFTIPDIAGKKPGVIWIGGERIEYFGYDKEGLIYTLSELRRGTHNTFISNFYSVGEPVYSANIQSTNFDRTI